MATSTKAKPRSTSKAKRPKSPKARPSAKVVSTDRPEYDDENKPLYIPKVGEVIGVHINKAAFWNKPNWGAFAHLEVKEIRDLTTDLLTFEEFAQVATQNIGRFWLPGVNEADGKVVDFFWNDDLLVQYWPVGESSLRSLMLEPGVGCFDMDDNSEDQPFERFNLRMIYRFHGTHSDGFMASNVVAAPTMEDRLRLIESFGNTRMSAEDSPIDCLRIAPEVIA